MATTFLVLFLGSCSVVLAQTCNSPGSSGCKFVDESPRLEEGLTVEQCCVNCDQDATCKAYTYERSGFFRESRCFYHNSTDLPKEEESVYTCAIKTQVPTPAPAPTPPPAPFTGNNWAVIIAGSKTFANYRHQADACHAYQIVKKHGIPESNIILMMEDDVAKDRRNPFPGKLFNKPTAAGEPGVDVYDGCVVDYSGADVTAATFLAVLSGDLTKVAGKGNGKVLNSTSEDNVFVNFADHGGGEIVEMPNGPYLHAKDLVDTLKTMHSNGMYRKLVFYMEACNGGSMFHNLLPTDIDVFATTAANPTEPSWGTYCPPQDMVDGKAIGACLGDLYSVNWMEDSDNVGEKRTLEEQFEVVVKLTNKSHPTAYGDQSWKNSERVDDYQAHAWHGAQEGSTTSTSFRIDAAAHAVDQRDIELLQVFYQYLRAPAPTLPPSPASANQTQHTEHAQHAAGGLGERSVFAQELVALIQQRENADVVFNKLLGILATRRTAASSMAPPLHFKKGSDEQSSCVQAVTEEVQQQCGKFSTYSLKYHHQLVTYCATLPESTIIEAIGATCSH